MKTIKILTIALSLIISVPIFANNVQVDSVVLKNSNSGNQTYIIEFDLSWENSWRTDTATLTPDWWDAVWVFAKYKVGDNGVWKHVKLSKDPSNYSIENTNGVEATITPSADSMGVFMHRTLGGTGNIAWNRVNFLWDYSSDTTVATEIVQVKVFALEMVYVPEGAFYVGDGELNSPYGPFGRLHVANDTTAPFHINSESEFWLGGKRAENLSYNDVGNQLTRHSDDFNVNDSALLAEEFPKGYNAFYCMKQELSQLGYVEFLNTLTREQQNSRTETDISGTSITNRYVMHGNQQYEPKNGIKCDATLPAIGPITFYCDLNNNDIPNEDVDGLDIACNLMLGVDIFAYADWAGMRCMTELEYEKAARGPLPSVPMEYAWGGTAHVLLDSVSNFGTESEISATPNANLNAATLAGGIRVPFEPTRSGIFATPSSTNRINTGASYYGILDLSGSQQEPCITIGKAVGRNYQAINGDGKLKTNGNADVSSWPSDIESIGLGRRGGAWKEHYLFALLSTRFYAVIPLGRRMEGNGLRLVRTAP